MEASSAHFVVYADESEAEITRFAQDLELYHHAMEQATALEVPDPSPSNRLTVFVVSSTGKVQQLYGAGGDYVGGFYLPRAGDSIAIVPPVHATTGPQGDSMIALLHEYAHHFLISNSNMQSPPWMAEGAAEFFASAAFLPDGGIKIGMPDRERAEELFLAKAVPMEKLLAPDAYSNGARSGFDSFYGRSWLLYHYLTLGSDSRAGELQKYLALLSKGENSLQAGRDAFGDLRKLDMELDAYVRQPRMFSMIYRADQLPRSKVEVRSLNVGEAEMMPLVMRTRRGVNLDQARDVLESMRQIAAKYPQDPAVLTELAEAECDAGNNAEAVIAADRALTLDPKRLRAYYQKGRALFVEAEGATGDKTAAYSTAIAPFLALNRLENDNPLPLIYYFRSYAERGVKPPDQAVLGLARAAELAPYDFGARLALAEYQIGAGDYAEARRNLAAIAYAPHGSPISAGARALIERIDSGKPLDAKEAATIMQSVANGAAGNKVRNS